MKSNSHQSPSELCSVLAPSCDAYSDLWTPFFTLFWRYWPDCPFPVFLGSNSETYDDSRVTTLHAGHGNNWTNRVREQISMLETPYVLMLLEDFFLRGPVSAPAVLECLEALIALDGVVMRLHPQPGPSKPVPGYPHIGELVPDAEWRVSTQGAIWKREALLDLMRDDESIWQFEVEGTQRAESLTTGFYGSWDHVMTYRHHVVEKGKWFRPDAAEFGGMNIGCNFTQRAVMSRCEMARWYINKHRGKLLRPLPRSLRNRIHKARYKPT